jgi:hypothetical protein
VSAPLQAISFSSSLLNVLLQIANKNGIQNQKKKKNGNVFTKPLRSNWAGPLQQRQQGDLVTLQLLFQTR